jgi:hypothetical protein
MTTASRMLGAGSASLFWVLSVLERYFFSIGRAEPLWRKAVKWNR